MPTGGCSINQVRRAKYADSLQDSCLVVIPALNEGMITEVIENLRREEFFRIRVTQLSLSNNQPTGFFASRCCFRA